MMRRVFFLYGVGGGNDLSMALSCSISWYTLILWGVEMSDSRGGNKRNIQYLQRKMGRERGMVTCASTIVVADDWSIAEGIKHRYE